MRQLYYRLCIRLGIYKEEDFVTVWRVVNAAYWAYRKMSNWVGLCQILCNSLREIAGISISYKDIPKYIPKFNPEFLGAKVDKRKSPFWWPDLIATADTKQAYYLRLGALEKLRDYYFYSPKILIKKGKRL